MKRSLVLQSETLELLFCKAKRWSAAGRASQNKSVPRRRRAAGAPQFDSFTLTAAHRVAYFYTAPLRACPRHPTATPAPRSALAQYISCPALQSSITFVPATPRQHSLSAPPLRSVTFVSKRMFPLSSLSLYSARADADACFPGGAAQHSGGGAHREAGSN